VELEEGRTGESRFLKLLVFLRKVKYVFCTDGGRWVMMIYVAF
jgi:hypothetical protein